MASTGRNSETRHVRISVSGVLCADKPEIRARIEEVHRGEQVRAEQLPKIMGIYGAPREIRTPGLLVRSQTLYPTELGAHKNGLASVGSSSF
jgi:hypothetical protein